MPYLSCTYKTMPRRRGPSADEPNGDREPLAPSPNVYRDIFPVDRSMVKCLLCDDDVPDIPTHLREWHPRTSVESYVTEFKGAPLSGLAIPTISGDVDGKAEKPILTDQEIDVSPEEAVEHPGGFDGAYIEKSLADDRDKVFFRACADELVSRGFTDTFLIADTAYQKLIVRRLRERIEFVRKVGEKKVFSGQDLRDLQQATDRVRQNISELEKLRAIKAGGEGDPIAMREADLSDAEIWVQEHIGEFVERCPNPECGMILTPPALPYWAVEPIDTPVGRQWPVWSPELFELVRQDVIEPWHMAFVLRTSIEGLMLTCSRRGEEWPDRFNTQAQEILLRRRLDIADRQALAETAKRMDERRE